MTDNATQTEADELLSLSYTEAMERVPQDVAGLTGYAMLLRYALAAEREKTAGMAEDVHRLRNLLALMADQRRRARQELHNTLMTLEEWPE